MNILGFSGIASGSYYQEKYGIRFVGHDSAAALVRDGVLVFAIEEERISREKHTSRLPTEAIRSGLQIAGMTLRDIDAICYTWNATPIRRLHMYLHHPFRIPVRHWPALALAGHRVLRDLMSPERLGRALGDELGNRLPRTTGVPHHLTHAACAYFSSLFDEAACLTVDGQGEDESATLGDWHGTKYAKFQSIYSPDSIGILYGMMTDFLGMRAAWDEYKVMGMASLGDAKRFSKQFDQLVQLQDEGQYRTLRTALVFKPGYCDNLLERILGIRKRGSDAPFDQVHFDVAAGLQSTLERVLFHLVHRLRKLSKSSNLCLGGGVFLNSVANGKIRNSGVFEKVFVPPVPGDHGGALGAAIATYYKLSNKQRGDMKFTPFSGPDYSQIELVEALAPFNSELRFHQSKHIVQETADLLAQDKIVGWFQGKMEYGPRALGHRSILASPIRPDMKDIINDRIKHREQFRPFAGAVPAESATDYFEMTGESPYMQFVFPVRSESRNKIPAVVHQGSCRAQTVNKEFDELFHGLLQEFGRRTGIPILLNTSLNDRDEPIVCSPQDAIKTFLRTDLDALVLGTNIVSKRN